MSEYSNRWMWSEAVEMLARAERLHRQLFEPVRRGAAIPVWEPPADLIETEDEVVAILALPGVDPNDIVAVIEGDELIVADCDLDWCKQYTQTLFTSGRR